MEAACAFVNTQILPHAVAYARDEADATPFFDPISELQRLLQGNGFGTPAYE